jgi:maltooligosyltrehalose trehalohydrolase
MLVQGQEFGASSPFLYFADHERDLAEAVRKGRAKFLAQFPSIVDFSAREKLDDPGSRETFERSTLDLGDRTAQAALYALHGDLLQLRHQDPVFRRQGHDGLDGAVVSTHAFVLRFFTPDHRDDRVLIVNLGPDLKGRSFAEPLLAPPPGRDWTLHWSSEDPKYGGLGTPTFSSSTRWSIPGEAAIVLAPSDVPPITAQRGRRRTP